jgi:dienelactone hydrolase
MIDRRTLMLGALLFAAAPGDAAKPRAAMITLPSDLSVPKPEVTVTGMKPGATVTLTGLRRSRDGNRTFVGEVRRPADRRGRVRLSETPDDMALFWAAKPRDVVAGDPEPGTVLLVATDGAVRAQAAALTTPPASAYTVSSDTPFPGAVWAMPVGAKRPPVIIVLGGSEGGNSTATTYAPLFAARGYAVLGLPYYNGVGAGGIAGLPTAFAEIPVDRLEQARAWLAARGDVGAERIGIWGVSKGAEFALIAASRYPWLKAVAAIVPTDVVWEGWGRPPNPRFSSFSVAGQALPFVPYDDIEGEFAKFGTGGRPDLRRAHADGRVKNPARVAEARIPIERYAGPLLVAGGGKDTVWPSFEMTEAIRATRLKAGRPVVAIAEPGAGHALAGPGTDPADPSTALGGDARSIATARLATWRATFRMFDAALKPSRTR